MQIGLSKAAEMVWLCQSGHLWPTKGIKKNKHEEAVTWFGLIGEKACCNFKLFALTGFPSNNLVYSVNPANTKSSENVRWERSGNVFMESFLFGGPFPHNYQEIFTDHLTSDYPGCTWFA